MKKLIVFGIGIIFNLGYSQANVSLPASAGTAGTDNVHLGEYAGSSSTANNNIYIGNGAGKHVTTGSSNVGLGNLTGANSGAGTKNTQLGSRSGETVFGGSENVFIGSNSGVGIGLAATGSSGNVCIGSNSGYKPRGGNLAPVNNQLFVDNTDTATPLIWGDFANDLVKLNGKVGVGGVAAFPTVAGTIDVSNYNLFVTGGILTDEVRVNLSSGGTWADYVFKKEYKLPSLKEVEIYIDQKGHLINVPSAEEVKANGIALGEMTKIQQEKIEELTLYVIEQNKINEKQNKEIEELKAMVKTLVENKK